MIKYLILTLCLLVTSPYTVANTGEYQLSTSDQAIIQDFVGQVQAMGDNKTSEIYNKITDLMSRARLTPRPYHALNQVKQQLQDGMSKQTITNDLIGLSIQVPKSRSIDADDTPAGFVLTAPQHHKVAGSQTISIYQINVASGDTTLDQHVARTQANYGRDHDHYSHDTGSNTTISSKPAQSYTRSAQYPQTQVSIQGAQVISFGGIKGITMTYTTTNNTYNNFVQTWQDIVRQVK